MCGITGVIKKNTITPNDQAVLSRMSEKIIHRGPNSEGVFSASQIAFKMRRLSIIDLSGGNQPLFNEDNSIVLIANGEIYNFVELTEMLSKKGHRFKTKSDCETIIHAYEEFGEDFLSHFRGMFAFCLYDKKNEKVILVRDRLGEKPLYLYQTEDGLFFSSEMKSILETLGKEKRRIDPAQLYHYFHYYYVPEPFTLIEGIRKLPPAHMLSIRLTDFSITEKPYWDMLSAPEIKDPAATAVRNELEQIEKIVIRSDVPVGISLSGGIDSSTIALLTAKYSSNPLHAFSVGYPNYPENDERKNAEALAKKLGLIFHSVEISADELLHDFDKMIYDMDDPVADIASYGYYRVAQASRQAGVPVLLAGFGGDELFWGYDWARKVAALNNLKKTASGKILLFALLTIEYRKKIIRHPFRTLAMIGTIALNKEAKVYEFTPSWRRTHEKRKVIFGAAFLANAEEEIKNENCGQKDAQKDGQKDRRESAMPDGIKTLEISGGNSGALVTKLLSDVWLISNCINLGDRLSMAHSIELRLPLLDYKLCETVIGLRKHTPEDYKLGYKRWLIDAVKDILPPEIINRKKRGFSPPSAEWSKKVVRKYGDKLLDGILISDHILSKEYLSKALKENQQTEFLYAVVVLERWLKQYYQ